MSLEELQEQIESLLIDKELLEIKVEEQSIELATALEQVELFKEELVEQDKKLSASKVETNECKKQLEVMKERIDDYGESEELVEQLTMTNLELTNQIEQLQATINELEELRQTNTDIHEQTQSNTLQLTDEIDAKVKEVNELRQKLNELSGDAGDKERTLCQYQTMLDESKAKVIEQEQELMAFKEKCDELLKLRSLEETALKEFLFNEQLHFLYSVAKIKSYVLCLNLRDKSSKEVIQKCDFIFYYFLYHLLDQITVGNVKAVEKNLNNLTLDQILAALNAVPLPDLMDLNIIRFKLLMTKLEEYKATAFIATLSNPKKMLIINDTLFALLDDKIGLLSMLESYISPDNFLVMDFALKDNIDTERDTLKSQLTSVQVKLNNVQSELTLKNEYYNESCLKIEFLESRNKKFVILD